MDDLLRAAQAILEQDTNTAFELLEPLCNADRPEAWLLAALALDAGSEGRRAAIRAYLDTVPELQNGLPMLPDGELAADFLAAIDRRMAPGFQPTTSGNGTGWRSWQERSSPLQTFLEPTSPAITRKTTTAPTRHDTPAAAETDPETAFMLVALIGGTVLCVGFSDHTGQMIGWVLAALFMVTCVMVLMLTWSTTTGPPRSHFRCQQAVIQRSSIPQLCLITVIVSDGFAPGDQIVVRTTYRQLIRQITIGPEGQATLRLNPQDELVSVELLDRHGTSFSDEQAVDIRGVRLMELRFSPK